jgi:hypothetical protein
MHQHHTVTQDNQASHMGCHRTATAGNPLRSTARDHRPSVACATCRHNTLLTGTALPPIVLPPAQSPAVAPVVARAVQLSAVPHGRLADTPDTPPPIRAA